MQDMKSLMKNTLETVINALAEKDVTKEKFNQFPKGHGNISIISDKRTERIRGLAREEDGILPLRVLI